jgi:DNA-directed RNA polymerase specialized sigma24 family protein
VRAHQLRLLNRHRHRLRWEDLEDCFSQASLELVVRAREGEPLMNSLHIERLLEQRFVSRIQDRRRALEGRSLAQASFEHALGPGLFSGVEEEVEDRRIGVEELVQRRLELESVGDLLLQLTADQRLVLGAEMECAEFCALHGWSQEKYRKVLQRGRAKLRALADREI